MNNSGIIDVNSFHFQFKPSQIELITNPNAKDEEFKFRTAVELCQHIVSNWDNENTRFQREIDAFLTNDPTYQVWNKTKTLLKDAPAYKVYRGDSKRLHEATNTLINGNQLSPSDYELIESLQKEIYSSKVCLKKGQTVFHGMGISKTSKWKSNLTIPEFLSTTLNPIVAFSHATRKSGNFGEVGFDLQPTILIIKMKIDSSTILGMGKYKHEQELLLNCGAQISVCQTQNFQVVNKSWGFDIYEIELTGFAEIFNSD